MSEGRDGTEPVGADLEAARIRRVFEQRDRRPARHPAIAEAYRLLNEERLERMTTVIAMVAAHATPSILDVGCGAGHDIGWWLARGWPPEAVAGIDLVEERVRQARDRFPTVDVRIGSATDLPFPDASFDVATAVTVLSSIRDEAVRQRVFAEMWRIVRPGGLVVAYDFVVRHPRNPNVVAMGLRRLVELGRAPTGSIRLSPLLQLVALGTLLGPAARRIAWAVAPPTHRLTWWSRDDERGA